MPNYRVYYNRRREAPQIWSVDSGDQTSELNVKEFRLHRCNADSKWDPNTPANPDTPSAWLEISHAVMRIEHGVAHFFHDPDWRHPKLAVGQRTPEEIEDDNERDTNQRISETP